MTDNELLKLKLKYLTAYANYQSCIAACSTAELRTWSSPNSRPVELAKVVDELDLARRAYRAALMGSSRRE